MKKILLLLAISHACLLSAQNCSVIYVNFAASGNSTGTSWQNAFTNLQDAITESANCLDFGVEIWVAKGTYRPDVGETQVAGNRNATFYLLDNLQILGGFLGTETQRNQRNWQANETILSGEVGLPNDSTDNIYTVVTAIGNIETAVLDGFTIRDGNASQPPDLPFEDPSRSGGGMHNSFGNPTINNCIFRNNTASFYGGGLYNEEAPATLNNCTFIQNRADYGGGIYHTNGTAIFRNCTILENVSNFGGGLAITGGSPELINCTISGNNGGFGGGLYVSGNDADPVLSNCLLSGNQGSFGGGVLHAGNSMTFYNCTIAGNHANSRAGGLEVRGMSTFVNCILWDNTAILDGNQFSITATGNVNLSYSCYPHGANDIASAGNFSADAFCITSNPLFVAPLPWAPGPETGGDYRLRAISAAINAGNNATALGVSTDLVGAPRLFEGTVDMGAYELQTDEAPCPGGARLYVNSAAAPGGDGTSWATAFQYLQDALNTGAGCSNIAEIWVAQGLYFPDQGGGQSSGNRDALFFLHNGLALFGGFAGNETMLEQRDLQTSISTLSGDIGLVGDASDNAYTIVLANSTDSTAILDGFTISGGQADFSSIGYSYPRWTGGGIYNEGGSPLIRNCTFTNNGGSSTGSGMYNWRNCRPTLINCTFTDNHASSFGSGMANLKNSTPVLSGCTFSGNDGSALYNNESSPKLQDCRFLNNDGNSGAAVHNISNAEPEFTNCTFSGNRGSAGGAVYNSASNPLFVNCLFSGNRASSGGAINNLGTFQQTYINCTFSGNRGTSQGGAIRNQGASDGVMTLNNCILWGNSGGNGNQIMSEGNAVIDLLSSCYANGLNDISVAGSFSADANCLTDDPLFLIPVLPIAAPSTAGDYRLNPCSSVIGEGANDLIPAGIITDVAGELRIVSGLVDMGAYEFQDTQNIERPQLMLDITNATCSNTANGAAIANVTEASPPYTYLWSGGQVTPAVSGLMTGNYAVTVIDNNGCRTSQGFSITSPPALESTINVLQNAFCGIPNGEVTVVANGGGGTPYTYLWSDGQMESTATGLSGGMHTVSITDGIGCIQTNSVNIAQSEAVEATINGAILVSCLGNDGQLSVQPSAGTGSFTYLWNNDETTAVINGLNVGDYSVTVTDSLGCMAVVTTTLEAQIPLGSELVAIENISCNGLTDGSATVAPTSGNTPFSYLWEDGQTAALAENLSAGSHSVTISDVNGCTTTRSLVLTEPPLLEVAISGIANVTCFSNNDGRATASGLGGTAPYSYLWSDGQTTGLATNLQAGDYTLEIIDAHACMASATITILPPQLPEALISATQNPSACIGNDGTASVQVTSGVPPYSYLWSNGQMLPTATGLVSGAYTVVVTDAAGCTAMASTSITSPPMLESEIINLQNATCTGVNTGTATVSVSGGTEPYTYLWNNGVTLPSITDLSPGQYGVSVTDADGCTISEAITITAAVTIFTTVSIQATNNCFGDAHAAILASPVNGAAPYTYLWSNGADSPNINNLPAGTYFVSITDANGCKAVAGAIISQPPLLELSANAINGLCGNANSNSATAAASGGTPPYNYLWSNGQSTATISSLATGTYSVSVTDAKNCTAVATVSVASPQPLTGNILAIQASSCVDEADGSASIQANGGTLPYTYLWSNGQTSAMASGLLPGNYSLVITDANSCTTEISVTVGAAIPALNPDIVADGETLSAVQNGAQYQWIDCNTNLAIAGATAQIFQPEISGSYAVMIDIGNCSVRSTCLNVSITAVEEADAQSLPIQVFPNPNHGEFSLILPEAAQVVLFNAAGAALWQSHFGAGRHDLNQRLLPAGVYWLQAIREKKVETVKVLIE